MYVEEMETTHFIENNSALLSDFFQGSTIFFSLYPVAFPQEPSFGSKDLSKCGIIKHEIRHKLAYDSRIKP